MSVNENLQLATNGFNKLLGVLSTYIASELIKVYGNDDWWQKGVFDKLSDMQRENLPESGDFGTLVDSLDISSCLRIMDIQWNEIFRKCLPRDCRNYVMELKGTRHKVAHAGAQGLETDDTCRALDTMSRLCEHIDAETTAEINELLRIARYGSAEGSMAVTTNTERAEAPRGNVLAQTKAVEGLPSWRDVMEPHMDVAEGRYRNAEFAADLAQVAGGKGEFEYRDPVEFFSRTYVTEGMKGLLVQSLRRVCGLDGEPVIQLKTAFGGGKTHSMLALYHMMRSRTRVESIENLQPVLREAGVSEIPEVHVAVIVGTALNPSKAKRPPLLPGVTVNTLWGEIACQLAESTGKPEIYDYVKESDKKGVSPGSEALANMFDACGCCMVLVDELVAYAKKLYGAEKLPAGTFDNFITFIQELTEAARASKRSLVVASIPESDNEIGGDAGREALEQIEHTFGRMEAIWKPVSANEGFEVVRRRLFLNCKNNNARERVCERFSNMYNDNPSDFPIEARELEYRERMIRCYPIHPEVFDRLYEDWATLERFQRTRGVLRLMAAVIHELWMRNDQSPMIMPGSFPLDVPSVRDELTRYLDDPWNGVVDSENDGKSWLPYRNDAEKQRYGKQLASRRVARAIMLGSAPDVSGQSARGIEKQRVSLGVVQPGENIAIFNDALAKLQSKSSYLYSDANGNRYWYDTRPTLRKTAEDRAQQIKSSAAVYEVERRLKNLKPARPFEGRHICPASSLEIQDTDSLRMVVLPIADSHSGKANSGPALKTAEDILNGRGETPRTYRNMIVFAAPDASYTTQLVDEAKRYLAWKSIQDDRESLNLDASQNHEVDRNVKRAEDSLTAKTEEAYCWLIVPRTDLTGDHMGIEWNVEHVSRTGENIIAKMGRKLLSDEAAIDNWAPALLKMELDKVLWKDADCIQIGQLWKHLCSYCYLPRLANYSVLEKAILQGSQSSQYFGIASGMEDGRYIDLSLGRMKTFINKSDYLVKPEVAELQIEADREARRKEAEERALRSLSGQAGNTGMNPPEGMQGGSGEGNVPSSVPEPRNEKTAFHMSAKLDNTRISKDVRNIVEEIVSQLNQLDGAEVNLTLTVDAKADDGIPTSSIRTVSENCNTLGINDFRFD